MNKGKLRSLMFHAGFCNEDGGWDNRPIFEQELDNFQRFAELIVRECSDKAHEFIIEDGDDFPKTSVAYRIKQHFGVK